MYSASLSDGISKSSFRLETEFEESWKDGIWDCEVAGGGVGVGVVALVAPWFEQPHADDDDDDDVWYWLGDGSSSFLLFEISLKEKTYKYQLKIVIHKNLCLPLLICFSFIEVAFKCSPDFCRAILLIELFKFSFEVFLLTCRAKDACVLATRLAFNVAC